MKIDDLLRPFQYRTASIMGEETLRKYGVLVPLVEIHNEIHILFEVRAEHLRSQPGDICFPGGKMDPEDVDAKASAIRETTEELGIPSSDIDQVFPLDYIVADTKRIIYPFAGQLSNLASLQINPDEVKEIFTVPLQYFMETEPQRYKVNLHVQPEEGFPYDLIYNGENYNFRTHGVTEIFYQYKDYVIWGLTARIITHFLKLLQSIQVEKG